MPSPPNSPQPVADRDIAAMLAVRERCQELPGFDADYADFPDYIIRCTHRIWEQKNLGLIRTHYAADCIIHTINGDVNGIDAVVTNTLTTLAGFPDRTLYGEDVIWSGDAAQGFFSSHRILSHLTNLGASEFGAPTGRSATVRTIADCEVRANRIGREWLVRDNLALVWQLGLNPHDVARAQAMKDGQAGTRWAETARHLLHEVTPHEAAPGSAAGHVCKLLDRIWNGKLLREVTDLYAPSAALHGPSGRELHGPQAIAGNIISLLATMPDARLAIDRSTEIPAERGGVSVAIRWRLAGTHSGAGLYGPPTGKLVLILGVSHFRVCENQVQEEWTVFDELGVLRQIYSNTESGA